MADQDPPIVIDNTKSASDKKEEEEHLHTSKLPYACNLCNKSFSKHEALGGHMTAHRPRIVSDGASKKVHECSNCHRQFPTGQSLGGHKRAHYQGKICRKIKKTSPGGGTGSAVEDAPSGNKLPRNFDLNELPCTDMDD